MRVTKEILEAVDRITEGCTVEITNCGITETYPVVVKHSDDGVFKSNTFIIPTFYYEYLPTIEELKDKIIIDIAEGWITDFRIVEQEEPIHE